MAAFYTLHKSRIHIIFEFAQASSAIRPLASQNELVGNLCSLQVAEIDCDGTKKVITNKFLVLRVGNARNNKISQISVGEILQGVSSNSSMNLGTSSQTWALGNPGSIQGLDWRISIQEYIAGWLSNRIHPDNTYKKSPSAS